MKNNFDRWMKNFDPKTELPYIEHLIDRLLVLSEDQIFSAIRSRLDRILQDQKTAGQSIILLPVREEADFYIKDDEDSACRSDEEESNQALFIRYHPCDPLKPDVGSEGKTSNFIRNYSRDKQFINNNHSMIFPSVENREKMDRAIRDTRCTVIIINDYAFSGQQLESYIDLIANNYSLRKRILNEDISLKIVVGVATKEAIDRITGCRNIAAKDNIFYEYEAPSIRTSGMKEEYIHKIEMICSRYSENSSYDGLGFNRTGLLFISDTTISDNIPRIFTRPESKQWNSLFPGRTPGTREFEEIRNFSQISVLFRSAEFGTSGKTDRKFRHEVQRRNLLNILFLLDAGKDFSDIMVQLSISRSELEGLCEKLRVYGLVGEDRGLTESGKSLLRKLRRPPVTRVVARRRPLDSSAKFYYPGSLR